MTKDVFTVVRSSGERTTATCQYLLELVFSSKAIKTQVSPFSRAIQLGYELGINSGKEWTLIVDADVLIYQNGVEKLIKFASSQPKDIFMFFGCIADKLMWSVRPGGVKLYRTALLQKALKHIPDPEKAIRPEEAVILGMEKSGYKYKILKEISGIHDFEQEYIDLAKKGFLHYRKHKPKLPILEPIWEKVSISDKDFQAFMIGKAASESFDGKVITDAEYIRKIVQPFFNGFGGKKAIDIKKYNNKKITAIIKKFLSHPYRAKAQRRLYKKYAIGL